MDKLYELIKERRRLFIVVTFAYVVFNGIFMFPIDASKGFSFWVLMLVVNFYIAHVFFGIYKKKSLLVFSSTLILNSIGLLFRILIEWGEYSITRDLTALNVGLYLISMPVLVTTIYMILNYFNYRK